MSDIRADLMTAVGDNFDVSLVLFWHNSNVGDNPLFLDTAADLHMWQFYVPGVYHRNVNQNPKK